ncbi:TPA: hypothetical protein DEO28_02910 [Candidatus Dependentiae bacterium]|nr:MAG: ABC-type multidrug transport system, permease component [candidate division TM6 bacterium GW2011_GWE2_31_21]KKP53143.1 MAG: ABC-type multidrug transport system, permease component [candidate division TM6 bacterium GW2011_GWF2_33_332]HBS47962.1 hypothetical protein [Candidatus Dependentiae bacterium]HBZ73434.1 hypothetical protein [Candidatus Dependentiae bacterium]
MKFKFKRVCAIVYRHILILKDGFEVFNFFYWTLLDILLFGFLGRYMQMQQGGDPLNVTVLLANLTLWYIVVRATLMISLSLMREFYDYNFVAIFSTPLTIIEWLIACIILGTIGALINFVIGCALVFLLFGFNVLSLGLFLIPVIISLLISGCALGFLTSTILVTWGKKAETLAFALAWFFVPFSGAYYSASILPPKVIAIAKYVPMYHAFESVRAFVHGKEYISHLIKSFQLNIICLIIIVLVFIFMFNKSKEKGLTKLEVNS